MARYRTIKPIHWNDKELPNICLQAHLLWIATWNFSDDEGIFEADVQLIRSQAFPRRTDIRTEQIEQWIGQLVKARFVIPFEYNGSGYYISRTFKTHQKIDKPQKSKIPKDLIDSILKCDSPPIRQPFDELSPNDSRTVAPVEESRVKESRVEESSSVPLNSSDGNLCYDIESHLLLNRKDFEAICMKTQKNQELVSHVLKKYHLFLIEKNDYPKTKRQLYAGLEKWILNEKNFSNGAGNQRSSEKKPTPTGDVAPGGFGNF